MERQKRKRRRLTTFLGVVILVVVAFLAYFPGLQGPMVLKLATGVGVSGMQTRIDELEHMAIRGETFSSRDKAFLRNLYTCLAKGAKLTYVLRQSGQMMERYLSCTGEPLRTAPRIFVDNDRVVDKCKVLRQQFLNDLRAGKQPQEWRLSPGILGTTKSGKAFRRLLGMERDHHQVAECSRDGQ